MENNTSFSTIPFSVVYFHNNRLEFPTVFVLISNNKFDFYNITEIENTKYQMLDRTLE
jgi:hypothetical protein